VSNRTWAPGVQVSITAAVTEAVRRSLTGSPVAVAVTRRKLLKVIAAIIWRDVTANDPPGLISPLITQAQQDASDAFAAALTAAGHNGHQRPDARDPYRHAIEKGRRSAAAAPARLAQAAGLIAAQAVLDEMAVRRFSELASTRRGPARRSLPVWRASLRMAAALTPRARNRAAGELGRARLRAHADVLMTDRRERLLAKHRKVVLAAWNSLTDSLDPHPLVRQFLADEHSRL
jgi:hypothetical protein